MYIIYCPPAPLIELDCMPLTQFCRPPSGCGSLLLPNPPMAAETGKIHQQNRIPMSQQMCFLSGAVACCLMLSFVFSVEENMALITNLVYYCYFNMRNLMIFWCVLMGSSISNTSPQVFEDYHESLFQIHRKDDIIK